MAEAKFKRFSVLVESLSPMLMNPATEEVLAQLPGAGTGHKAGKPSKERTREEIAAATTANFFRLFKKVPRDLAGPLA